MIFTKGPRFNPFLDIFIPESSGATSHYYNDNLHCRSPKELTRVKIQSIFAKKEKQRNNVGQPVRLGAAQQRLPKEGEEEGDQVMVGVL